MAENREEVAAAAAVAMAKEQRKRGWRGVR